MSGKSRNGEGNYSLRKGRTKREELAMRGKLNFSPVFSMDAR
jgi:predicted metal-dependent peptidase